MRVSDGNLLDVVRDEHAGGRIRVRRQAGEPTQQILSAAEMYTYTDSSSAFTDLP